MKIHKQFRTLALGAAMGALTLGGFSTAHAADIPDTAAKTGMFNTLLAAAKAAGVVPMLVNDKNLTIFAPTDDAFKKLPAGTVDNLLKPENKDTLKKILAYHVLTMKVSAKKAMMMPSGTNVKTAEGEKLILRSGKGRGLMLDPGVGMKATVIKPNVMADNGIIHVIDTVLIPPSVQRMMDHKSQHDEKGRQNGRRQDVMALSPFDAPDDYSSGASFFAGGNSFCHSSPDAFHSAARAVSARRRIERRRFLRSAPFGRPHRTHDYRGGDSALPRAAAAPGRHSGHDEFVDFSFAARN